MGHEKIIDLRERDGEGSAELWGSYGIEDVFVKINGRKYDIPEDALKDMFGRHFKMKLVSQIEQMDDCDIIEKLMKF